MLLLLLLSDPLSRRALRLLFDYILKNGEWEYLSLANKGCPDASIHRESQRDCLKSLDEGQIKPRGPTKIAKEDLVFSHRIANNGYLAVF